MQPWFFEGCDSDGYPTGLLQPTRDYIDSICDRDVLRALREVFVLQNRVILRDHVDWRMEDIFCRNDPPTHYTSSVAHAIAYPEVVTKRPSRSF